MGSTNFNGTGQFKFVLYHGTAPGTVTSAIWSNTSAPPANANEPSGSISALVTKGLYSIELGETPGQKGLPADLEPTAGRNLYLRIWFNDGVNGFQQLAPDRKLGAVPFARHTQLAGEPVSQFANDAGYLSTATGGTINADLTVIGNFAAGLNPSATGGRSAAFGHNTEALGFNSMAWGFETDATTTSATAWGSGSTASGVRSTAWGSGSVASGGTTTAWGEGTNAESYLETVFGRFDTSSTPASTSTWVATDRLLTIGKGVSDAARADALVLLKSGDTTLNGELCVNDDVLTSGNFKFKTPKAGTLQLSGYDFIPSISTTGFPTNGTMRAVSSSAVHQYVAAIHLPAGATVTSYTVRFFEESSDGTGKINSVTSTLRKRNIASSNPPNSTIIASINAGPSSSLNMTQTTSTITGGTIGANDAVYLDLTFTVNNTLNIGISGATIAYTTDTVNP